LASLMSSSFLLLSIWKSSIFSYKGVFRARVVLFLCVLKRCGDVLGTLVCLWSPLFRVGRFPSSCPVEVAVACSFPVRVLSFHSSDGYLVVKCEAGFERRCKLFPGRDYSELRMDLDIAIENKSFVVFESFGNWDPNSWFSDVRMVLASVTDKDELKTTIFDYTAGGITTEERKVFIDALAYAKKRLRIEDSEIDLRLQMYAEGGKTSGFMKPVGDSMNDFYVMVSKHGDLDTMLNTLFHELRHVAQFYHGVMRGVPSMAMWKDELIINADYRTSPWEVDARKAADILFQDFKKRG